MTRWVKTDCRGPTFIVTTSPTAMSAGATGSMTMAEPSGIVGSIDRPPMIRVWRPDMGTPRPRTTPNATSRMSAMIATSTTRRTVVMRLR